MLADTQKCPISCSPVDKYAMENNNNNDNDNNMTTTTKTTTVVTSDGDVGRNDALRWCRRRGGIDITYARRRAIIRYAPRAAVVPIIILVILSWQL